MTLPQWTRRPLVLVALIFSIGGFFVGSASSQQEKRVDGEVGTYQMVVVPDQNLVVFDTKTARYWLLGGDENWHDHPGPLAAIPKLPAKDK